MGCVRTKKSCPCWWDYCLPLWKTWVGVLQRTIIINDASTCIFQTIHVHVHFTECCGFHDWLKIISVLSKCFFILLYHASDRASDISRKKKQNFAGFSGANSRKNRPISRENRPISRDFRGRKVKIRRKIV